MNEELASIPQPDRGLLFRAMAAYQRDIDVAWQVDKYTVGLMRMRNRARGAAGRCLFFATVQLRTGEETLVALAAYKKEGRSVPKNVMQRAEARLREWKRKNGII